MCRAAQHNPVRRPYVQAFFRRTPTQFTPGTRDCDMPDGLWVKCRKCADLIYRKQLEDQHKVCPRCDYHFRLTARERIAHLLDPHSFLEHDLDLEPTDPLGFVGAKDNYPAKLKQMQAQTGLSEALICGSGRIQGIPIEIAIADFHFMGGSMGSVYGEKVACAAERACAHAVPLITINASGGARMHEGVLSLMQMAKVSVALTMLAQARQLHISVLVDPCYGGVSASYASVADIILAEPGAHIGFAGPRVIEQTMRQKLPPHFQTAEFLLEHGMIDGVVARSDLRATLARVLQIHAPAERAVGIG
jgi:acetyl-CoA carboxylase carboxyl transferase subunit beta